MPGGVDQSVWQLRRAMLAGINAKRGTATGGTANTLIDTVNFTEANDFFNGMALVIHKGTNAGQVRIISDYDLGTTTLTLSPAFDAAIDATSQYVICTIGAAAQLILAGYDSSAITENADGGVLERLEFLQNYLAGTVQLTKSKGGPTVVEINNLGHFEVGLWDVDTGAIAAANITAGTYDVDRSTGGGAWANVVAGVANTKADGLVYCEPAFTGGAPWIDGDLGRVTMEGIQAVIDGHTYFIEDMVFAFRVSQEVDIETKVDAIQADIGNPSIRDATQNTLEKLHNIALDSGLGHQGPVSAQEVGSEDTEFYIATLIGRGDDFFNDNFYAMVLRAGGVAPEHEIRKVTDYSTADGLITVFPAFSADIEVGDEILLFHETLMNTYTALRTLSNGGQTYFVGAGGNDASDGKTWEGRRLTVASGYGLCVDGDTLLIGPGTYTEDIAFDTDGVTIIGNGVSSTQIAGTTTMTCGRNVFQNILFYGNNTIPLTLGNDAGSFRNTLRNCRIESDGTSTDALHIDGTAGGSDNAILDCDIMAGTVTGIVIDNGAASQNKFRNCRIFAPGGGIHGVHINNAAADRNTFDHCIALGQGSTGTGFLVSAGDDNLFYDCGTEDFFTTFNVGATNHLVGCHEESQITAGNTLEEDLEQIYEDTQSEIASCALEQSTILSELESSATVLPVDVSELQSKMVSHALEQSVVLSELQSALAERDTDHSDIQSEIASHVTALSASDSEHQSKLVSHSLEVPTDISELYSSADSGYDNVTSEIASHVLAESTARSEMQSKLVSHALEQSTVLSGLESSAGGGVCDTSELQSKLVSHSLEISTSLSQIESSADTIVPEHSDIESEIASHALEQSEILSEAISALAERDTDHSEMQSKLVSHALEVSTSLSDIQSAVNDINPEGEIVQSELASHVLALSAADSELQSKLVSHAAELATEEGYTQSEIASHVTEQSSSDSEHQSKLVSHSLEQSEVLSEAGSSLDTISEKAGFGALVTKAITFTNLAAAADLFTVTGDVIVQIVAVCTTNLASAGGCNAEVGIAADPDALIKNTDVLDLIAREIWNDNTPVAEIEPLDTIRSFIISDGNDIIITPSLQIDSGAIAFYCFWTPLSSGATVVAA